jgi:uncharacterized protein
MSSTAALALSAKVRPGAVTAFFDWQLAHNKALCAFAGFTSCDVIAPPDAASTTWTVVLNFRSEQDLIAWRDSAQRATLAAAAHTFLDGQALQERMATSASPDTPETTVTEVIFSYIKPGMEEAYRAWTFKIQAAQAKYPGYRGSYLQPPTTPLGRNWTTLLRYASTHELEAWMASPERAALLEESKAFIDNEEFMRFGTAFPGWVPVRQKDGESAAAWKIALLVLLTLFPVVMLEIRFLSPLMAHWHLNASMETFIGNALSVAITSFLTVPACIRWFDWWLFPEKSQARRITLQGAGLLATLFALEIAFFAWLPQ